MTFVCRMSLAFHDSPGFVQDWPQHISGDIGVYPGEVNSRGARQKQPEQLGAADDHDFGGIARGAHRIIDSMHHRDALATVVSIAGNDNILAAG